MSASEFEGHEALIAELRAGTLDAPERLHRRVLEQRAERPSRVRMPRRRLVLVLPVAAALAVGAALIHGAFDSGPQLTAPTLDARATGQAEFPSHKQALVGTASSSHGTLLSRQARFSSDSVTIPKGRLVHAAATLQVVVANHDALSTATNRASQIVTQLGGYAQSVQFEASRGGGSSYLDLRVPVGKTQTALGRLAGLGKLVSQQVSTQDLEQTLHRQTDTIGALRRAIAIYEQALQNGSLSGSQRVDVQIRLANARHALAVERKARGRTLASGATASIQLTLTTNHHAFAVGSDKPGRIGRLLSSAGHFLALEGIVVLYALIVAGPIVLLGALAWWLARERRRRDERRLLASA